jgi:hypothetical protein
MEKHLEILTDKFLHHQLTQVEANHLEALLEDPVNLKIFREQVEMQFLVNHQKEFNPVQGFNIIGGALENRSGLPWRPILKYAAIFVVLIGILSLFWNNGHVNEQNAATVVYIENETGDTEALNLEDEMVLHNKEGEIIGVKTANLITYKNNPTVTELVYNTIRVPNGTLFSIVLSDGTKVELNAGSELKYPVQFIKGKDRQVFIKGEGFFNVSKDSQHPFKVNTRDFDIVVLGTEFNVSAYENQKISSAVLVEGSVRIENNNWKKELRPGELASIAKSGSSFQVQKVKTRKYIAWRDGITIFHNENFGQIIKTLERKYNVKINNNYPELEQEIFTATIVDEDIEQVLTLFSKSRQFKFEINERKITIDKKVTNQSVV